MIRATRRRLIEATGTLALVTLAGCVRSGRPEVRMDRGVGVLHPATDRYIANGLQPDGHGRVFVTATADASPELVGPDAAVSIADALAQSGENRFHVVVQIRSSPDAPIALSPAPGRAFEWTDRATLRATVEVKPWGSLDRIDDRDQREALRSSKELTYTAVWTLTPEPTPLPSDVSLLLASRR